MYGIVVMLMLTAFSLFMTMFVISEDEEPLIASCFSFSLGICMAVSVYLLAGHH